MTDVLHRLGRKALDAKAKHRWLTACAQHRPFVDAPGALRLAILLFEYYNPERGFAYPSRRTLSERLGSPPESVSRWMSALKGQGAIKVEKASDVPEEVRKATRKTSKRANYYRSLRSGDPMLFRTPQFLGSGENQCCCGRAGANHLVQRLAARSAETLARRQSQALRA